MTRNNFEIYFYLIVIVTLLSGCASMNPKREGRVTSYPKGATIYLSEPATDKEILLGITPTNYYVQYGLFDMYLVAEKQGYKNERWKIPRQKNIDHHFNLERSWGYKIKKEKSSYNKKYLSKAIEVIGTLNSVLNSPRFEASQVANEAQTEIRQLKLNHPEFKEKALTKALEEAVELAKIATDMEANSKGESTSVRELDRRLKDIESALEL